MPAWSEAQASEIIHRHRAREGALLPIRSAFDLHAIEVCCPIGLRLQSKLFDRLRAKFAVQIFLRLFEGDEGSRDLACTQAHHSLRLWPRSTGPSREAGNLPRGR